MLQFSLVFLGSFAFLSPYFRIKVFLQDLWDCFLDLQLGQLKEPDIRTVFYFTLISTVGSATLLIGQEIYMPAIDDLIVLLILGTSATIAQIALTRAYRVGNTLSNAGMSYLTIIFSALLGLVVLDEAIDMLSLIGIVLIILSGIFVSFKSSRLK